MNIKITKTISLGDVPAEIRSMIANAKGEMDKGLQDHMSEIVRSSLSNTAEEFFSTITELEQFRERLAKFDEVLQEVSNVLLGYKDIVTPDRNAEQGSAVDTKSEATPSATQAQFEDLDDDYMEKVRDLYSKNQEFLKSNGYATDENEEAEHEKHMSRTDRADEGFDEEG